MTEKELKIVALTGCIGSGKSQVADMLREMGVAVIDADVLAREAVRPGEPVLQLIRKEFGESVILPSGELDRKALGKIVFKDTQKRKLLEGLLHPEIRRLFKQRVAEFSAHRMPEQDLLLYVIPLLFDTENQYPEFNKIVVVSAPRELCLDRIMARDGSSKELAELKLNSQLPIEEKEKRADKIIYNIGSLKELREKVAKLYQELTK